MKKHPRAIAYEEGVKAGKAWRESVNPYKSGTARWQIWNNGFEIGCSIFNDRREKEHFRGR